MKIVRAFGLIVAGLVLLATAGLAVAAVADDVYVMHGNGATCGAGSVTAKIVQIDIESGAGPKTYDLKRGNTSAGTRIWTRYTSGATNGTTYTTTLWSDQEGFKIPQKGLYLNTDDTTARLFLYTKGIQ